MQNGYTTNLLIVTKNIFKSAFLYALLIFVWFMVSSIIMHKVGLAAPKDKNTADHVTVPKVRVPDQQNPVNDQQNPIKLPAIPGGILFTSSSTVTDPVGQTGPQNPNPAPVDRTPTPTPAPEPTPKLTAPVIAPTSTDTPKPTPTPTAIATTTPIDTNPSTITPTPTSTSTATSTNNATTTATKPKSKNILTPGAPNTGGTNLALTSVFTGNPGTNQSFYPPNGFDQKTTRLLLLYASIAGIVGLFLSADGFQRIFGIRV